VRIVHSSDWHIGRLLHGVSLLEDQREILGRFVAEMEELQPDAIIIAGDIYDRAVPPKEAVELLDETLHRLVMKLEIPTLVIAGNHDSAERLGFASRMLEERGLYIEGPVSAEPRVVPIEAGDEVLDVALIPYAAPEVVRSALEDPEIRGHDQALAVLCQRALEACEPGHNKVAVAHAFVVGGEESESERALMVGGASEVPTAVFDGFDYVALGHLHRPQRVGADHIRYSGSLLKYSFSETGHDKGYSVISLGYDGLESVEHRSLPGRRNLRRVEGTLAEVVAAGKVDPDNQDYIQANLTDEGILLNAMAHLREAYPNALQIIRPSFGASEHGAKAPVDPKEQNTLKLFESFFAQMRDGDELSEAQRKVVVEAIETVEKRREERES
jgi:exonuclease SbcD